jgi:Mg-chelatase subunit ChlD
MNNQPLSEDTDSILTVWIVIIDRSGSMSSSDYHPSRLLAAAMAALVMCETRSPINPDDLVVVIAFNTREKIYLEPTNISNFSAIEGALMYINPDGMTTCTGLQTAQYYADYYRNYGYKSNVILLSDGYISTSPADIDAAESLKLNGTVIDTVGIAGRRSDVDEQLLKQIATTDPDGYIHYRFIDDTDTLVNHYKNIATGLRM